MKASFFSLGTLPKRWFYIAFILKLMAGGALWLIYTFYYPNMAEADIYKRFR